MGRRSHALIAATAGLIALIVAVVLVLVDFEQSSPEDKPDDTTATSEATVQSSASTSAATSAPEGPPKDSIPSESDPYPQNPNGALPADLIDVIPAGMMEDGGGCSPTASGISCTTADGRIIDVDTTGTMRCDDLPCSIVTGRGDESVEYAVLNADRGNPPPFIEWNPTDYPDIVIRVTGEGDSANGLLDWWVDHL